MTDFGARGYADLLYRGLNSGWLIFVKPIGGRGFTRVAEFDLSVPGTLSQAVQFASSPAGVDCYIKYNLFDGSRVFNRGPHAIGGKADVKTVVAFGLDVDVSDKNGKYLDAESLRLLCSAMPVPPSLIVGSDGVYGGMHVYWCIDPVDVDTYPGGYEALNAIACRWYRMLAGFVTANGGELDATAGLERLLRFPGSLRSKSGNRVCVLSGNGTRYNIGQLTLPPDAVDAQRAFIESSHSTSISGRIGRALDAMGLSVVDIASMLGWTMRPDGMLDRPEASSTSPTGVFASSRDGRDGVTIKTPGEIKTLAVCPVTGDKLTCKLDSTPRWLSRETFWVMASEGGVGPEEYKRAASRCGNDGDDFVPVQGCVQKSATQDAVAACERDFLEQCRMGKDLIRLASRLAVGYGLDDNQAAGFFDRMLMPRGSTWPQILRESEKTHIRGLLSLPGGKDPHYLATKFAAVMHGWLWDNPDLIRLRQWREDFYRWDMGRYVKTDSATIKNALLEFVQIEFDKQYHLAHKLWRDEYDAKIEKGDKITKEFLKEEPKPTPVNRSIVDNVMMHLNYLTGIDAEAEAPFCVGGLIRDLSCTVVLRNGMLSVDTGKLDVLDPRVFTTNTVDYRYSPKADCPRWEMFLEQVFSEDRGSDKTRKVDTESIRLLQEWFGLCLVSDTSFHKMLWLLGPPRSGKSTICKILTHLVGKGNVATPSLSHFTGNKVFGLEQMLNKSVAIVADSRVSGTAADREQVVEQLLGMVGEDMMSVNRKNKQNLFCKIGARFLIASNETSSLPDASGALASRSLYVETKQSFEGREDRKLEGILVAELEGIFNWAVEGLQRLRMYGDFKQPISAQHLKREAIHLSDAVGSFVGEMLDVGDGLAGNKQEIYDAYRLWCGEQGIRKPLTKSLFSSKLYATSRRLNLRKPVTSSRVRTVDGDREYVYTGVKLKTHQSAGNQ